MLVTPPCEIKVSSWVTDLKADRCMTPSEGCVDRSRMDSLPFKLKCMYPGVSIVIMMISRLSDYIARNELT